MATVNSRLFIPQNIRQPVLGVVCTETTGTIETGVTGIKQGHAVTVLGKLAGTDVSVYLGPAIMHARTGEKVSVAPAGSICLVQTTGTGQLVVGDKLKLAAGGLYEKASANTDAVVATVEEAGAAGALLLARILEPRRAALS